MIRFFLIIVGCVLLSHVRGYASDSSSATSATSSSENQKTTDNEHSDDSKNTQSQEKTVNGKSYDSNKTDVRQDKDQSHKASTPESHKNSTVEKTLDKAATPPAQPEQKTPDNTKSPPLPQDVPASNKLLKSHSPVPAALPVSTPSFQRIQNRTATFVTVGGTANSTVKNTADINGTTWNRKP